MKKYLCVMLIISLILTSLAGCGLFEDKYDPSTYIQRDLDNGKYMALVSISFKVLRGDKNADVEAEFYCENEPIKNLDMIELSLKKDVTFRVNVTKFNGSSITGDDAIITLSPRESIYDSSFEQIVISDSSGYSVVSCTVELEPCMTYYRSLLGT